MIARIAVGLLLAACSVLGGCERAKVEDGVPRAEAVWKDHGLAPADAQVRALVGLRLPDRAALDAFVRSAYDPRSPAFRKYLSAEEATARFGPSADDLASVEAWLEGRGLEVARVAHNRLIV